MILKSTLDKSRSEFSGSSPALGLELATWWQRAVAFAIDLVLLGIVAGVFLIVAGVFLYATVPVLLTPQNSPGSASSFFGFSTNHSPYWWELFGLAVCSVLYFAILDAHKGTIGKRSVGIAVCDKNTGRPIGVLRALVRSVVYVLFWMALFIPGLLNVLSPLSDRNRQAWHDHAVGSIVVEVD